MTIGDLGTIITGKTPSTKVNEYWDGEIPFVTPRDLQRGKHVLTVDRYITKAGMESVKGSKLPANAICVSCIGNIGYVSMTTAPSVSNQQINSIIVNDQNDPNFVYYLIRSMWQIFKNYEGQSTTLSILNKTQFSKMEVDVPPLEEQKRIAAILAAIDDKIESNQQINDNLQQQAQLLFHKWFIDNPDAAYWKHGNFAALIDRTINGDWGKDSTTGNFTEMVYCIRGADIPEVKLGNKGKMPTRFILPKNYQAKKLMSGDIVVEISGGSPSQSTGRAAVISEALLNRYDKGMICTNFCKAITPRAGYSMFIYHYWQYLYDAGVFFGYENGTTGIKNLDVIGIIEREDIVLPNYELIERFDTICQSLYRTIYNNGLENERLAAMRNTLLPRLLGGEIDVSMLQI